MPEMNEVISADYETRTAKVKAITTQLEQDIKELFLSDRYKDYLSMMAKLHHYSANNSLLIMLQKPDASMVAGMSSWNRDFKRYVNKGEKGILVLAPAPYSKQVVKPVFDENGNLVKDENGEYARQLDTIKVDAYKPVFVYDVSQTHGKPVPELGVNELSGDVKDYYRLFTAIKEVSPCEISFEEIKSGAKGYYDKQNNRIAIKTGMSEIAVLKSTCHEIAHAIIHNEQALKTSGMIKDRETKEVEAESIAYTVCAYYGIDTSDYSLGYIAGWSRDKDVSALKASMETIRKASSDLIDQINDNLGLCLTDKLTETDCLARTVAMTK